MGNKLESEEKSNECKSNENFMVQFNHRNSNVVTNISCLDQRRAIFISLIGLFQSWKQCPSITLYTAIIIVPLQKKWIYHPTKYEQEMNESLLGKLSAFSQDLNEVNDFIELLKFKDSQNLVFWMLDPPPNGKKKKKKNNKHDDNNNNNMLVAPFWNSLSSKLTNLYDPITKQKYKPLILDDKWWKHAYNKNVNHSSKFDVSVSSILMELYFVNISLKFKAIQEIIYQSNPHSLNPIIAYNVQTYRMQKVTLKQLTSDINVNNNDNSTDEKGKEQEIESEEPNQNEDEYEDEDEDDGDWFIASDYNPNDIDPDLDEFYAFLYQNGLTRH